VPLAFVTGRQHVLRNKVGLTFQDREDVDALLQELERHCEHRTVFTLTSIAPSFFSYEPVLRRLQHHRVLPFEAELPDGPSCDPSVCSIDELMEALTDLTTQHTFNASQVDTLNYAMTHRVALIQGPPGLLLFCMYWCFDYYHLHKSAPHRNVHFIILISRPIQYLITFTPTQARARLTQGSTLPATLCTRASSEYCCATTSITPSISS
jgi:hypothetical protein